MAKNKKQYAVVYQTFFLGDTYMELFDNKSDQSHFYNEQTKNKYLAWKMTVTESNIDKLQDKK